MGGHSAGYDGGQTHSSPFEDEGLPPLGFSFGTARFGIEKDAHFIFQDDGEGCFGGPGA